jgi:hypothetical protein
VHTIILPTQVSAFEVILALMAILVASWCILNDCAHNYLLVPSFVFVYEMVKDGRVIQFSYRGCMTGSKKG